MAYMDYMDPNAICPQKDDKLNLSLSLSLWIPRQWRGA